MAWKRSLPILQEVLGMQSCPELGQEVLAFILPSLIFHRMWVDKKRGHDLEEVAVQLRAMSGGCFSCKLSFAIMGRIVSPQKLL